MVSLEKAVIARYEHGGERFEVLVDPDLAWQARHGKTVPLEDLLAADTVFRDAAKGDEQSEAALHKAFGTTDLERVVRAILAKGEVQLTTEQRKRMLEKKRTAIVQYIAKNAFNPQTQAPHPPARIEQAMREAGVHIDPFKPVHEQVERVVQAIQQQLPLSMQRLRLAVAVPAAHAGKAAAALRRFHLVQETWKDNGDLVVHLEVPAGLKNEVIGLASKLTHGVAAITLIKEEGDTH